MKIYLPVAAFLMLFFASDAVAQFGQPRYYRRPYSKMSKAEKTSFKRTYFGFSLPVARLNFSASSYSSDAAITGSTVDQKVYWKKNSPLKPGMNTAFGLVGGTSAKLAKAGSKAMIGLDWGVSADLTTIKLDPLPFVSPAEDGDEFKFMNYRFPVILAYKRGGEVTMKKADKTFFSIGAGVVPTALFASYRDFTSANFALHSVLMVEGGGLVGLGMKMRLCWYPSTSVFFDEKEEYTDGTFTERATLEAFTGGSVSLSAIFLIGTPYWSSRRW